jgi:hypothetical protein
MSLFCSDNGPLDRVNEANLLLKAYPSTIERPLFMMVCLDQLGLLTHGLHKP